MQVGRDQGGQQQRSRLHNAIPPADEHRCLLLAASSWSHVPTHLRRRLLTLRRLWGSSAFAPARRAHARSAAGTSHLRRRAKSHLSDSATSPSARKQRTSVRTRQCASATCGKHVRSHGTQRRYALDERQAACVPRLGQTLGPHLLVHAFLPLAPLALGVLDPPRQHLHDARV